MVFVIRVVSRNRTLFPLEPDLRGAMFDSNVACHKMLTSEWFCLSRAYNSHTIVMSVVVCVKVLSLEASVPQPSLVRKKNRRKPNPLIFLEESEWLYIGWNGVSRKFHVIIAWENRNLLIVLGCNRIPTKVEFETAVSECFGTHCVILCCFQGWFMGYGGSSSTDWSVLCVRYFISESRPGDVPLCIRSLLFLSGKCLCF